ncbi:LytR family transcriptional regulator [Paenibacillaceae bacterium]|nr:LytR family transcriptional regulator [Paenibacillaceae bacterium]
MMNVLKKYKWLMVIAGAVIILGSTAYMNRSTLAMWGFDIFLSDGIEKKLEKSYKPLEGRDPKPVSYEAPKKLEPFSMLLLGIDRRGQERGRSDTMIYTVVRPADGALLMVSIPRDAFVTIPGRKNGDKIAHAYAYGAAELAVETVEKLFDQRVDHYAAINFDGFKEAIDALDGIPLPIENDIINKDPNHEKFIVKAGQDLYNGQDALNFVRYREDSDMNRTGRHQLFINALLNRATDVGQWTKIPHLIDIMGENFSTDLTPDDMIDLGKSMLQAGTRTIYGHSLKGEGRLENRVGGWYYDLDDEDLDKAKAWIENWLDASVPKGQLLLPDQYQSKKPVQSLSASEEVQP